MRDFFTPGVVAGAVVFPIVSTVERGLLGPLSELISQDAWFDTPVGLPSVNDIIRANAAGFLSNEQARRGCFAQGARFWGLGKQEDDKLYSLLWKQVAINGLDRPGPSAAMEMWAHGLLSKTDTLVYLKRAGADIYAWWNNRALWEGVPQEELIMRMYAMGLIDGDQVRTMLARAGGDVERWLNTYASHLRYPGLDATMRGFVHGRISEETRNRYLRLNSGQVEDWVAMLDVWATYPGVNEVLRGFIRGRISEEDTRSYLDKQGADFDTWAAFMPSLEEMPLPQMALQALARNRITQEYAQQIIRQSGGDWSTWAGLLPSMQSVLSITDTLEARNRGLIAGDAAFELMFLNGVNNPTYQKVLDRLRERMPSPGEILAMGTRGAFSPEIGNSIGLYDGMPAVVRDWLGKVGLYADAGVTVRADEVIRPGTIADMYWASSRRGMSLEQAIAAYRRLRPEEIGNIRRFVPDADVFDREKLRGWMTYLGLPQSVHAELEELGYLPLSLREIRTVVRLGTRPKEWVIARLQDQGHRADRAADLYDILADQERWRREAPIRALQNSLLGKVAHEVQEQYSVGTVARPEARDYLINSRVNPEVADQLLNIIDARLASNIAKEGIRAVRKDYLNGTLNATEVVQQLEAMGIVEQRIRDYVALWTIQRNRVRRTATTAQILSWVAQGILDGTTAQIRLANLGWDRPDIITQIGIAQGKLAQQEARAHSTEDKRRLAAAKELTRVQKENERMRRQLQADQRRATPRTVLDKWLCSGAVSEAFYLQRMAAMGYDARTAQEYLEVALGKKACKPAPEGTPFPSPPTPEEPTKPVG